MAVNKRIDVVSKQIEITSSTKEETDYIDNAIGKYNAKQVPFTQQVAFEGINFIAKNEKGDIIGGINAMLYCWGVLHIDILWVDDNYRSVGVGSELMEKIQGTVKQKGCSLIHLDTFDFQAKDFYLKHGFEVFGTLDNCR
ncbi:MAG: GNAT family N-acetyltransferase [Proteobacteria bacterium]|nr:GNAT family N-acetyltransferase [Pseudomonadota bacterium]